MVDQGKNMFADKATIQDVNSTMPASDGGSLGGKILVADQKDASMKKRRVRRDGRKDDQSPEKDSKSSLGSKKRGREDSDMSEEEE
jgi:hypothetical protein